MIRLSAAAERDLRQAAAWITAHYGPLVSARVIEAILTSIEYLDLFPKLGRPGRVTGTRELVIARMPYVAVYMVTADNVVIARVLHQA